MSTRSFIAKVVDTDTLEGIYCHHDGYPEGVGKTLLDHYNSEKTQELLKLGNISVLEPNLIPKGKHSFDHPEPGVTIAYSRDRGEKNQESVCLIRNENIVDACPYGGIDWFYLLDENDQWLVRNDVSSVWVPVKNYLWVANI